MTTDKIRVLALSDDDELLKRLRESLGVPFRGKTFDASVSKTEPSCLADLEQPDCAVIDGRKFLNGCDLAAEAREIWPDAAIVGARLDDDDRGARFIAKGGDDYVADVETASFLLARVICHAVERRRLISAAKALAVRDEVTSVYTQRHLIERLPKLIASSVRHKYALTMCVCEVSDLDGINRRYGRPVGDKVLAYLGGVMDRTIRKEDLVGRFGGNELAAVFSYCSQNYGIGIIQRIRDRFDTHEFQAGLDESFAARISCGLAEYRQGQTVDQWIGRAEAALAVARTDNVLGISLAADDPS